MMVRISTHDAIRLLTVGCSLAPPARRCSQPVCHAAHGSSEGGGWREFRAKLASSGDGAQSPENHESLRMRNALFLEDEVLW